MDRHWRSHKLGVIGLVIVVALTGCASHRSGAAETTSDSPVSSGRGSAPQPDPTVAPATVTAEQRSAPKGSRAVDALGLEILVPAGLELDPICDGNSVSRPGSGLTYAIGCIALMPPVVRIMTAEDAVDQTSPAQSLSHCSARPRLDGETGCEIILPASSQTDPWTTLLAVWPAHDVAVTVDSGADDTAWATRVIDSARWVPVDRHGCVAARSPVSRPTRSGLPAGQMLPPDTTTLSICWYQTGRLTASASITDIAAIAALNHPSGMGPAPGIGVVPGYHPQRDAPPCTDLAATEGVVFLAHRASQPDAESVAQLADCRGGQIWTDGQHSVPVTEALASALRPLTQFLLVYGYSIHPL